MLLSQVHNDIFRNVSPKLSRYYHRASSLIKQFHTNWCTVKTTFIVAFVNIQCVQKVPSGFWKIVARKQIELATCGLRQITVKLWKLFLTPTDDLMTWRPVSGIRSRLFQRTCSTKHGKSSNIVWTFSVLPRESTSRSTEVSKKLPEFHCNMSQNACG
jgi:hypothetical protein